MESSDFVVEQALKGRKIEMIGEKMAFIAGLKGSDSVAIEIMEFWFSRDESSDFATVTFWFSRNYLLILSQ